MVRVFDLRARRAHSASKASTSGSLPNTSSVKRTDESSARLIYCIALIGPNRLLNFNIVTHFSSLNRTHAHGLHTSLRSVKMLLR